MEKDKSFGIRSNNVILENSKEPVPATILISSSGKISDIIIEKDKNPFKNFENIINYNDDFIFPGIIDTQINFHATHKWGEISELSSLAAKGGITTVINHPLMRDNNMKNNELKIIQKELKLFESNCKTDFGLISVLNENSLKNILELKKIILGFKLFLSLPEQNDIDYPKSEEESIEILQNISENLKEFNLFIQNCYATDKEINLSSPYKILSIEERFNENVVLQPKSVDGFHGNFSNSSYNSIEDSEDDQRSFSLNSISFLLIFILILFMPIFDNKKKIFVIILSGFIFFYFFYNFY